MVVFHRSLSCNLPTQATHVAYYIKVPNYFTDFHMVSSYEIYTKICILFWMQYSLCQMQVWL
jgi:hypothetical protein